MTFAYCNTTDLQNEFPQLLDSTVYWTETKLNYVIQTQSEMIYLQLKDMFANATSWTATTAPFIVKRLAVLRSVDHLKKQIYNNSKQEVNDPDANYYKREADYLLQQIMMGFLYADSDSDKLNITIGENDPDNKYGLQSFNTGINQ